MTHNVESYHLWDNRWRTRASKTCVRGCRCAHGVRKLSTDPSICDGHATCRCLGRLLLREQSTCYGRDSSGRLPQQLAEVRAVLDLFARGASRNVDRRFFKVRELEASGVVKVKHVPTASSITQTS